MIHLFLLATVLPLGGFHGNEIPLARVKVSTPAYVWDGQKTDGRGHLDLWDASDGVMRRWFRQLAANGVTAIRLFPRARVNGDTLDLCGKLNPELQRVFQRAFAAAKPYGIRFLLQILPEPVITGYWNRSLVDRFVLPRYSRTELAAATPAQLRFLTKRKEVHGADYFTDPDVLACQKLYLEQALRWIAKEPQVFALEVYNEQGHSRPPPALARAGETAWQDAEIRWTAEIVRFIHERLPHIPVTISHPGHGITGYDPVEWTRRAGADFYSAHYYAGLCGENPGLDFAATTAASTAFLKTAVTNYPGEWGVLDTGAPREVLRTAHRDAIWLTLLAGAPGFMQWTYDFVEEYRWPSKLFRALPAAFSPEPAPSMQGLEPTWREFQAAYAADLPFFMLNSQRRNDSNLRHILDTYRERLQGAPGWQVASLTDSKRGIWIAYVRSREIRAFGKTYLGVPVARPLALKNPLDPGEYHAYIIDPGKAKPLHRHTSKDFTFRIRGTEFVLVLSRDALRF